MKLGVNIDHVATLREARKAFEPDPVGAAVIAELAGAHGITIHLRADRRHIQDRDLYLLRKTVKTKLNLEMAATEEMIEIACNVKPDTITLVPEKREEITTEGGLNVVDSFNNLKQAIATLQDSKIKVGIFVDPDKKQVVASKDLGVDHIEINTARYSEAKNEIERHDELKKISEIAEYASSLGLKVNAGHGLNYINVADIAKIPHIEELNIGHNIIARAVMVGLDLAVREMIDLIK